MADNQNQFNQNAKETAEILKDAFMSLGAQIDDIFRRAATANDSFTKAVKKDLTGTLNSLARNSQQLLDNEYKLNKGQLASRNVAKQIYDITSKQKATQESIKKAANEGILTDKQKNKLLGETNDYFTYQLNTLNKQLDISKDIESRLGLTSKLIKDISKIPILGSFLDTQNALEAMQTTAAAGGSKFEAFKSGLSGLVTSENLVAAGAAYIAKQILVADENTTKLAKSLNQSKTEAAGTQVELTAMAFASGDAYLNTNKLVEATVKLGQQLGIARVYSADVTTEFAKLTGQMGLAEESAASLAKMSIILGKNSHNVTTEALGTAQALQSQAGIQLDNKQILEESGKVSGQLLANFKANPTAIAAAVTQARLLGTTLEQTKKQSESLLDFQSSIENELKAELMTGQQLNLERARAAALMGDQETVMKELANQNMNFTKFSQMNTIAQKNVAAALGLSADELSDQLATQQFINKSRSEVVALAGEEVAKRLEAQKAQDKFNNALEKLQDVLMPVLTALAFVMDKTADLFSGNMKGFFGADDLMSGYGNRTLSTPQGTYALNNNDTVIAGTNLFKGNDVYSGPAGALSLGGGIDYDKLASAMSKVQVVSQVKVSEFGTPLTTYQQQNMRRSV
jgi:hypothetical protein